MEALPIELMKHLRRQQQQQEVKAVPGCVLCMLQVMSLWIPITLSELSSVSKLQQCLKIETGIFVIINEVVIP